MNADREKWTTLLFYLRAGTPRKRKKEKQTLTNLANFVKQDLEMKICHFDTELL